MGIEVGALIALVTVLAVYLLPLLVGRRELLGHARAGDRFSQRLRVLATGASAQPDGETCTQGGHAEIFRRRPEVRGMKRPAVRNVRALRTERELVRARRAHAQARQQRAVAASHRLVVACVLLGALLGTVLVAAVSPFPWWPVALPVAALGVSMVAGRRAALASQEAERRELRRIAELESELERVVGHRSTPQDASAPRVATSGGPADAGSAGGELAGATAAADAAERDVAGADAAVRGTVSAVTAGAQRAAEPVAAGEAQGLVPAHAGADGAEAAGETTRSAVTVVEAAGESAQAQASGAVAGLTRPATPPQGWHPVHVPAPTYTLVGAGPRRRLEELEEAEGPSAPVPLRPVGARPVAPLPAPTPLAPIDLDEVLERRRAAGE